MPEDQSMSGNNIPLTNAAQIEARSPCGNDGDNMPISRKKQGWPNPKSFQNN